LVNILGFDIGGANTKAAFIRTHNLQVMELKTGMEYFPIWKRGKAELPAVLKKFAEQMASYGSIDAIGVTMTAELSDAYQTKREGVNHVLDCVVQCFPSTPIYVLNVEAEMILVEEARKHYLTVASANWAATGWMVSRLINNCIVVDVGSTSTSIIPIVEGRIAAEGKTDLEKLANGELVYTGALRTNIATIVSHVPLRRCMVRVSSELFAQSGDVHLLLGNISEEEYNVDTADGRGKSRAEAMARLARVVCADIEMLSQEEIMEMARYIYERQVDQIAEGLMQVYTRIHPRVKGELPVVITGIGGKFLGRKAAERVGIKDIIDLGERLGANVAAITPCVGVALMTAEKIEGRIQWKLL